MFHANLWFNVTYPITEKSACLLVSLTIRQSPDNTVSLSTVPGLTQYLSKGNCTEFLHLTGFLSEIHISCHIKPKSNNQFLRLMTLHKNNLDAKYIDCFCFYCLLRLNRISLLRLLKKCRIKIIW